VTKFGPVRSYPTAFASAYEVLRHARRLLGGAGDPTRVLDFAVRGLRVELPVATRYHVGGDVVPAAHGFSVGTSRHAVPVLRPR
jgi:hypothetical protein